MAPRDKTTCPWCREEMSEHAFTHSHDCFGEQYRVEEDDDAEPSFGGRLADGFAMLEGE